MVHQPRRLCHFFYYSTENVPQTRSSLVLEEIEGEDSVAQRERVKAAAEQKLGKLTSFNYSNKMDLEGIHQTTS